MNEVLLIIKSGKIICLKIFQEFNCKSFTFYIIAIFSVGRLFVSLYGYLHAGIVLMKHLIDPGQFVLFWISLLMNQFWIEYFSVRYQYISFQL